MNTDTLVLVNPGVPANFGGPDPCAHMCNFLFLYPFHVLSLYIKNVYYIYIIKHKKKILREREKEG